MFSLAIKELTGVGIPASAISVALTAILIVINLFGWVPYIGILIYGMVILVIEATGLASASSLSFMILIDAIIFVILAIYAALWSKFKLKLPLFRPPSLEKVMAMEHPAYFQLRKESGK